MQLSLAVLLCFVVALQEKAHGSELKGLSVSVRGLGMGGAYTAVVDNVDALFYNPASLAKLGAANWLIADPRISMGNIDSLTELQNVQSGSLADSLAPLFGQPTNVAGGARTAIGTTYFAAGVLFDYNVTLEVENPPYPELTLDYANDANYMLGLAFPIVPGFFYAGGALKAIRRIGTTQTFAGDTLGTLDPAAITGGLQDSAFGYGLDMGFNMVIPTPIATPTFSLVWQNLGSTVFSATTPGASIPSEPENLTLGVAVDIDLPGVDITPAIELRHLSNYDEPTTKKVHMGVEVSLPIFDLRGGFYQGYYSLGLGMGLGPVQLDVATWGVEMGAYPGQIEDRRYALQLTFEVDIGGTLDLFGGESSSAGGKGGSNRSRRLKQRR